MTPLFEGPVSFAEQITLARAAKEADRSRNSVVVLEARGPFDRDAWTTAVAALGRRHEALRSSFHVTPGGAFRRRVHDLELRPTHVDLSSEARPEAAARAWIEAAAGHVQPLDTAPLARAVVLRLGVERHLLVFLLDHVLVDAASGGVALRDLEALYAAARRGEPADLPPAAQPRDVAAHLEPVLAPVLAEPDRYFPERADDAWQLTPDPDLPGDIVEGDTAAAFVPLPSGAELFRRARRHRVSPGCLLAAALAWGLRADAGRPDVAFALVRRGTTPETASALAFQIYTDLWAVQSGADAGPVDLLHEAAAFLRRQEPWRRAYVALRSPPTRRILFNQVGAQRPVALDGLDCTLRFDLAPPPRLYAQHDLVFRVADLGPAVVGALGYRARRFHGARMQRVATGIQQALAAFEGAP